MDEEKQLQQSPNWEKYKDVTHFVEEGFPHDEGFPHHYLWKTYTVITRDGTHYPGSMVDDSRQYRDEGLEWRTSGGNRGRHVVIAWKEEEEQG